MNVLLRGLPDAVHQELVRRAAVSDKSLRAYLLELLTEHVATPSTSEWLAQVRALGPAHGGGPTGPDLVSTARAEDDELAGR